MPLTPEQKKQLQEKIEEHVINEEKWIKSEMVRLKLDKVSDDPKWIKFVNKRAAWMREYMRKMRRATYVHFRRLMLDENKRRR